MRYRWRSTVCAVIRDIFLLILLTKTCYVNASSTTNSKESLDDEQKSNLRRVVSNMIGVNAAVERRSGQWSSSAGVQPVVTGRSRFPSRYIYRLYERYRSGDVVHGADTIRSVNAELGIVALQIKIYL